MRIILEKEDLITLLSKALGVELDDESVEISTDPFEVRISKAEKILNPPVTDSEHVVPEDTEEVDAPPNPFIGDIESANAALVAQGSRQPHVLGQGEQIETPPSTKGGFER